MRKYQILVDGALVSVYTPGNAFCDREEILAELREGELAALLYPESDADYSVTSFDKNNIEPREPYLVFAALSCFFGRVLGFPKMMIDIKWREKIFELPIGNEEYKFSVNSGKSKILCTKTVKFADGIEICVYLFRGETTIASIVCHDSELFLDDRLTLVLSSLLSEGVSSAIAVCASEKLIIKSVGDCVFYDAVRASVLSLLAHGIDLPKERTTAICNGTEHSIFCSLPELTFYPYVKYLC